MADLREDPGLEIMNCIDRSCYWPFQISSSESGWINDYLNFQLKGLLV